MDASIAARAGRRPGGRPVGRRIALVALLFLLAGCAGTRERPPTPTEPAPPLSGPLAGQTLVAEAFAIDATEVAGGHHEGLLQVRQPWIWDLSAEQRAALYGKLKDVARYAFLDELKRLGLQPTVGADAKARGGLELAGSLRRVELNTYGRGLSGRFEGFGSAGDYWEARVAFTDVRVLDRRRRDVVWQGDLDHYAKRPGSPAKLDYTHWDLLSKSLQIGLAGRDPGKLYDAIQGSKADYTLGPTRDNPVEWAARLAARDLAARLQALPRFAAPR